MKLRAIALVAVLTGVLALSAPLGAAPIPGSTYSTLPFPSALTYLDTSRCPSFAPIATTPDGPRLNGVVSGWYGPISDSFEQQVQLSAEVSGTIADARGTSYHVVGHFSDDSVHSLLTNDLRFDGDGLLAIAGPGGVIVGRAHLRAVTAPSELQLTFTHVNACVVFTRGR